MPKGKSLRGESRADYFSGHEGTFTGEDLKEGALLRIADAVEKMASSHDALRAERDRYKNWYEGEKARATRLYHRNASLRGYITRLKKQGRA